ncbi:MAG: hypothetical protein KGS61_17205, partial [Verrucomicrobia bacterium]|nr:hypothetical protein [Verrucomicrobiota bacterium]
MSTLAFKSQYHGHRRADPWRRRRAMPVAFWRLLLLLAPLAARAGPPAETSPSDVAGAAPSRGCLADWFAGVSRTQAEQPHWITPLVTVTPRLEEELRYDQVWQSNPGARAMTSYGGGKGLELIPAERIETIIGLPAWQTWNRPAGTDGWSDESFLVKYRLCAANEEKGNYIVSLFLGLTLPTGSDHNTANHVLMTPTLAAGKGWGNFDVQGTLSVGLPDNGASPKGLGTPLLSNTTFQYRILKVCWPEFEINYAYWPNGARVGFSQVFLTPGLVIGRLALWRRLGLTFGVGYQVAVTARPLYNHSVILSA